jgi:hypothetical protein
MKDIHLSVYGNPAQGLSMVEVFGTKRRVGERSSSAAWSVRRSSIAISF